MKIIDNKDLKDNWKIISTEQSTIKISCKKCNTVRLVDRSYLRRDNKIRCWTCRPKADGSVEPQYKSIVGEKSFKEIANKLDMSETSVIQIYKSAMKKMKCECQKDEYKTLRECLEEAEAIVVDQIKF